ncbi:zinc finger BED domain-containing 4-like [Paramuricea clavata]|uniref:Zinc finger BED domain-containing 4-like n=1 Tax=Paramuricea clavata TaxID=317549 RepID=A0A6S7INK3_PARCT|nr:zinc finger BED domain-containing 4-like [Paramuricea clavata]
MALSKKQLLLLHVVIVKSMKTMYQIFKTVLDFTHVDAVLHASHFPGSHTGVNIAEMFCKICASWNIHKARRELLVRDRAANMFVGSDLAEIPSIHCTIHQLQLVIEDAILSQLAIIDLLAKGRRLVTHFNHSALARKELKMLQEKQGKVLLLPIQDVPTRWNSAYLMMEHMVKLKLGPNELNIRKDKHYVTVTTIDPQYKNTFFQDTEKAKAWLLEQLVKVHRGHLVQENLEEVSTSDGNQNDNSFHAGPDHVLMITNQHKVEEATNSKREQGEQSCLVSAAEEVDMFMMLPLLPQTVNR